MVKVNDGNTIPLNIAQGRMAKIKPKFMTEADENCALCTAAAICNLGGPLTREKIAYDMTSGDVLRELGGKVQGSLSVPNWFSRSTRTDLAQIDILPNRDQNNDTTNAIQRQTEGIYYYCKAKLGDCAAAIIGNASKMYKYADAVSWMMKQENNTLFAIYFILAFAEHSGAHWLVAQKKAGALEYRDYQTDRAMVDGSAPTVSNKPVIGILGSNYSDKDMSHMKMILVAFQPWKKGSIVPART
jgi:hypothetical protein